jgi:hypothetical protein
MGAGGKRVEPLTSCMPCKSTPDVSENQPQLTSNPSARCTSRCTENEDEPIGDPLAGLVASLSPADRARLIALLSQQTEGAAVTAPSHEHFQTTGEPGEDTQP